MTISEIRKQLHGNLLDNVIGLTKPNARSRSQEPYPNFADSGNSNSKLFASGIVERISEHKAIPSRKDDESSGTKFEGAVKTYLENSFSLLNHVRPGDWHYSVNDLITNYFQYEHLKDYADFLTAIARLKPGELPKELSEIRQRLFGNEYIVKPDIVISRSPLSDEAIGETILGSPSTYAERTPLRMANYGGKKLLHASISCKWSLRSDRAQNVRSEAQNLIRNRKGNVPHVVAVTMEPLPSRLKSLALGTGDLDCVYHVCLHELLDTIQSIKSQAEDQLLDLHELIDGKRLRDISDLPFDLAI